MSNVNNGERRLLDDQVKGPLKKKTWTVVYELQQNDALIALEKEVDEKKSGQDEMIAAVMKITAKKD